MDCKKTILVMLACMLFFGTALAEETIPPLPNAGNTGNSVQSQIKMPGSVDFGIPQQSFASPEYVAQERMLESMTTAYNWITLNSSRFAQGCKTDKPALITEITTVLSKAQETSTVCKTFETEAKSCNPKTFCAKFKQGNLPLPQNAITILKKLGYDPTSLKIEDITTDLITKVCIEQRSANTAEKNSMIESVKQKIQDQLPEFKKKCELLKQTKSNMPNVMLPNIEIRPQAQQNYQNQQFNRTQSQTQGGACKEPHPDCYPLPAPKCNNGNWVCEGAPQKEMQQQNQQQTDSSGNIVCQSQAPECSPGGPAPMCQNGNWTCPQQEPAPQPIEQPQPVTEPQPAPVEQPQTTTEPVPAETPATTTETASPATGAVTMAAVCGNNLCEPDLGENNSNCQQDCMPNSGNYNYDPQQKPYNQQQPEQQIDGQSPQQYNPQQPQGQQMPYGQQQQPYGNQQPNQQYNQQPTQQEQQMPYGQGQGTQQPQVNNFVMPGPEQLCQMSDEEIIDIYTKQMSGGTPSTDEIQLQCGQEAQRELNNMGRFKLEIAKCEAESALDCEAKKQALSSCSEMKSSPEKVAGMIVDSMCRKFGVNSSNAATNGLYAVADKWANSDPALANQLGDTADKVTQEKKKLDVISYVFGNGDYANKLSSRAAELRTVRQKLASSGVNDQETLRTLDSQAEQLETESSQFKNLIDFGRIGQMFAPK
ncbi:MAG: hypothetical protein Q7R70_06880 [Candidatus Diapherotrites archaeon]|nr:hypothetical protein [Candidatus Diapherotrites archaeon]